MIRLLVINYHNRISGFSDLGTISFKYDNTQHEIMQLCLIAIIYRSN